VISLKFWPVVSHFTGQKSVSGSVGSLKEVYTRCPGTVSIHSLRAESSSATICCSQCGPTKPRKIFDLLIEYYGNP
jgi:hypothetical protein